MKLHNIGHVFIILASYLYRKFAFCQYPFLISMGGKMNIMEFDAKRQMETKAKVHSISFFSFFFTDLTLWKEKVECIYENFFIGSFLYDTFSKTRHDNSFDIKD